MNEYQSAELEAYLKNAANLSYKRGARLSSLSTFRIGGEAAFAVFPETEEALAPLLKFLSEGGYYYRVFGNGSNVLFDDAGFDGAAVFLTKMNRIVQNGCTLTAEAGVPVTQLAVTAQRNGLSGMEFLYGIPGSLGGAVYMNAGAYGGEIAGILRKTVCLYPGKKDFVTYEGDENRFAYRHSRFMEDGGIVVSAEFCLQPGDSAEIRQTMEELMAKRKEKQPLEFPSAGSTFKRYPGTYTGKLIEAAGLKGCTVGGAQVSEKHAGFIINRGGATSRDVRMLIDRIRDAVRKKDGITIVCEVEMISPDGKNK